MCCLRNKNKTTNATQSQEKSKSAFFEETLITDHHHRRSKIRTRVMSKHRIVLLGDSTLDNVVWVAHEEDSMCLSSHLQLLLTSSEIVNWAADGFTSDDVLNGGSADISRSAREAYGDPFPTANPFSPLQLLEHDEGKGEGGEGAVAATATQTTVLSVGGNDIRHILRDMTSLPSVVAMFTENYREILKRVVKATSQGRVIIVMQYRPALDEDDVYGVYAAMGSLPGPGNALQKLHALMEHIFEPVHEIARTYGLPVIDLPNTLDPRMREDFKCQIEPSHSGGAKIAKLIAHVVQCHDFACGESLFYSQPDANEAVVVKKNDLTSIPWRVTMP